MDKRQLRVISETAKAQLYAEHVGYKGASRSFERFSSVINGQPLITRLQYLVQIASGTADDVSEEFAKQSACRGSGCNWCCYMPVDVSPAEVVTLIRHLEHSLSDEKLADLKQRCAEAGARAHGLTAVAYAAERIWCPLLLANGNCGQYKRRPLACRTYHSMDLSACKNSYDTHGVGLVPSSGGLVAWAGGVSVALGEYLETKWGIDGRPVNFIPALAHFFTDGAIERWKVGAKMPDHIVIVPEQSATVMGKVIEEQHARL